MDWNCDGNDNDDEEFSWESDDDEKENRAGTSGEACEAGPSQPSLYSHFIAMGFSKDMVEKAIIENGEGNSEAVLETLLTYSAIENPSLENEDGLIESSIASDVNGLDYDSYDTNDFDDQEFMEAIPEKDRKLLTLIEMGFSPEEASAAIDRCGLDASVLELADSIHAAQMAEDSDGIAWGSPYGNKAIENPSLENEDGLIESSIASDVNGLDYDSYDTNDFDDQEFMEAIPEKDRKLLTLIEMGFSPEEASAAIDRCGLDASVLELADSIHAAQMAEDSDGIAWGSPYGNKPAENSFYSTSRKKRRLTEDKVTYRRNCIQESRRAKYVKKAALDVDDIPMALPKPMIGFGLPFEKCITHRNLPESALGPPYFYYENVALAPKGVWDTISRFLYDIEPEFVDSKYFCAAMRKRAYIHNLPIENRFPRLPIPKKTIQEVLPATKKWWPEWDKRTQLNCLQTCTASAKLTERIRKALEGCGDVPSLGVQEYVLAECRKWNLVWVGHHKAAPLEPDEIEMLLGFPRNHTRGGGISRTDRLKSLGNSFQVDTVAYHLSVLKNLFPDGIHVLSLFSGIGGAEVALHSLGIRLKAVVSVEISEVNRTILRCWWEQTNQKGILIDVDDVQQLNGDKLEEFMQRFGAFDLVIGGSPCNNLTGSNRHTRDGLEAS